MDYIFTFLVYLIEILQKRYKGLFIVEAMSPSGNKWIKKYKPKKVSSKRKNSNKFIIDETQIKVGSQYISGSGLQSIEPKHRQILQIDLSSERTMLVAERFIIASLINNKFDKCPVSTDCGLSVFGRRTSYPFLI